MRVAILRATGALAVLAFSADAQAITIYADSSLPSDCAGDYSITDRTCSGSDGDAYDTLAEAANAAMPGDTVIIRAGQYAEALAPPRSGAAGRPITFQGFSGENAVLPGTGTSVYTAFAFDGLSHIVVERLSIVGATRYVTAENAHHITIRDCRFEGATHGGAAMKFHLAHHNQFIDNEITGGYDLIMLRASDHNLVQGNRLIEGEHALFAIRCGSYNIVRNNYLYNETNKIGEIYDCCSDGLDNSIPTERNLVEGNVFARTSWDDGDRSPEAGIQFAGQRTIVRRNVFYECLGGINLAVYPGSDCDSGQYEAYRGHDNRIYHNVFFANHRGGMIVSGGTAAAIQVYDNDIRNNIFSDNDFMIESVAWPWWEDYLDGQPIQFLFGRLDGFAFESNAVITPPGQEQWACVAGSGQDPLLHAPTGSGSIADWETELPDLFAQNTTEGPDFVDGTGRDFRLAATSPLIDRGVFLTHTVGAGSGTVMGVEDARYFHDGLGVDGQSGDLVQLEGETEAVRVLVVDPATHQLTLEEARTWTAGQGVALAYDGAAPDIGAFEHGMNDPDAGVPDGGGGTAGTGGSPDGGVDPDASAGGAAATPTGTDDGCGCRVAGTDESPGRAPLVLVLVLGLARRARRSTRH